MGKTVEQNIEIVRNNIDELEECLDSADENGLFKEPGLSKDPLNTITFQNVLDKMYEAQTELDTKKNNPDQAYRDGWKKFLEADTLFNKALNSASGTWRFKYLYGAPFAIYYIAMLIVVYLAWTFYGAPLQEISIFWVPAYAFLWGLVGSILQGLWFLWQHVSDRVLRRVWIPWYLSLPVIGTLLGALMYLVYMAGFISTTGITTVTSNYFIMLLCALAGFASRWAVELLDSIKLLIKTEKSTS